MLTEAVRNTQPEPKRPPKAERDRSEKAAQLVSECKNLGRPTFPKGSFLCAYISGHTQKAAKVSLDGSCRCVCVEVLRRAVLERSPCSLLFGRTRPSMRPVGALPVCRANDM